MSENELQDVWTEVMAYLKQKYPDCWLRQVMMGKEWITLQIKFGRKRGQQK